MKYSLPHFSVDLTRLRAFPSPLPDPEFRKLDQKFRTRFTVAGFYDWPVTLLPEEFSQMTATAKKIIAESDGVLFFGIGGSHLGAATLMEALLGPGQATPIPYRWVSNMDPYAVEAAIAFSKRCARPAAVVISKSGNTLETLAAFSTIAHRFEKSRVVVITDPRHGELRRITEAEGWASFEVPPNIGGRYSVLTPVGLFPAAVQELKIDQIIQGAIETRSVLENCAPEDNPALQLGWHLYVWDRRFQKNVQYFMPYHSQLERLADWFVQLWGESLGKRHPRDPKRGVGATPVAALGSSDQHSILQLIKEGPADKLVGFVGIENERSETIQAVPFKLERNFFLGKNFHELIQAARLATEKSLENSAIPTYRLELTQLDERSLGGLLFFLETACAYAAECYEVNAFDQPGVEESKILLKEALSQDVTSGGKA